jgi:imidazolonepropionase-like amidohydrolase
VTLCPGFIDAHTHLTVGVKSYYEFFIDRFRRHVAEKAYQAAVHARVTLEGGFTTVRDVGCLYPDSFIDVIPRLRQAVRHFCVLRGRIENAARVSHTFF